MGNLKDVNSEIYVRFFLYLLINILPGEKNQTRQIQLWSKTVWYIGRWSWEKMPLYWRWWFCLLWRGVSLTKFCDLSFRTKNDDLSLVPHGKGMMINIESESFREGWFRKGDVEGFRGSITNDLHHSEATI